MPPPYRAVRAAQPQPFGRAAWWDDRTTRDGSMIPGLNQFYQREDIQLLTDPAYDQRLHAEFVAAIFDFSPAGLTKWFQRMGGNAAVATRLLALFPDLKRSSVLRAVQRHGVPPTAGRKQNYAVSAAWQARYYALIERFMIETGELVLRVYGGVLVSDDHRRRHGDNEYAGAEVAVALTNLAAAVEGRVEGAQFEFTSTSCDLVEVEDESH